MLESGSSGEEVERLQKPLAAAGPQTNAKLAEGQAAALEKLKDLGTGGPNRQ